MAKRSQSVLSISEAELTRLMQENGSRIISELGNHRINEAMVEKAKMSKPITTEDFSFHRLHHLIGAEVKVKGEAPTFKNKLVKLLELSRHAGGIIYALVEDRTGGQKLIEDNWIEERKPHKNHAKPRWEDGHYFKSGGEADRYLFLKQMVEIGEISNLKVGPRFLLQEKFEYRGKKFPAQYYTADFQYDRNGVTWIEDWKKKQNGKKKGFYVANTTVIGRFLHQNPDVNFCFASELKYLP